jgi:hypothetical protein
LALLKTVQILPEQVQKNILFPAYEIQLSVLKILRKFLPSMAMKPDFLTNAQMAVATHSCRRHPIGEKPAPRGSEGSKISPFWQVFVPPSLPR